MVITPWAASLCTSISSLPATPSSYCLPLLATACNSPRILFPGRAHSGYAAGRPSCLVHQLRASPHIISFSCCISRGAHTAAFTFRFGFDMPEGGRAVVSMSRAGSCLPPDFLHVSPASLAQSVSITLAKPGPHMSAEKRDRWVKGCNLKEEYFFVSAHASPTVNYN